MNSLELEKYYIREKEIFKFDQCYALGWHWNKMEVYILLQCWEIACSRTSEGHVYHLYVCMYAKPGDIWHYNIILGNCPTSPVVR